MNAILAAALLGVGATVFTWAYVAYRRPTPKAWTEWSAPLQLIMVSLIACLVFGFGYLVRLFIQLPEDVPTLSDAAIALAIVAVAIVANRLLVAHLRKLRAAASVAGMDHAADVVPLSQPAGDVAKSGGTVGGGRPSRRKRAA